MRTNGAVRGWLITLALTWSLGLSFTFALAQDKGPRSSAPTVSREGETPLHITAAQLEADEERHLILFKGQVKAVYGDATLYADRLLIFYRPKKSQGARPDSGAGAQPPSVLGDLGGEKLDRIEAQGNVRVVQGDRVATAQQAVYYKDREEIVLTGRPQVWRGENLLKGERLIVHLDSKKVVVESSPQQRVEAHLYQSGKGLQELGPRTRPPASRPGASQGGLGK